MSAKAAKKLLATLGGQGDADAESAKQTGLSKWARRKQLKKTAKKSAIKKEQDPERVREANLRFYRRTAEPSGATQELLAKVLSGRKPR
jgi:hypothetical protein